MWKLEQLGLWILTDLGMNSQPCHILAKVSWACHFSQSLSYPSVKRREHHWIPILTLGFKTVHTSKYLAHSKHSVKCRALLLIFKYPLSLLFKHFPKDREQNVLWKHNSLGATNTAILVKSYGSQNIFPIYHCFQKKKGPMMTKSF